MHDAWETSKNTYLPFKKTKEKKRTGREGKKKGEKKDLTIYCLEEEEYVTFLSLSCEARTIFIPKPDKHFTRK